MTNPFYNPGQQRILAELGAPEAAGARRRVQDRQILGPTLVERQPPIEVAPPPVYDPEKSGVLRRQRRSKKAADATGGRSCCIALAYSMQRDMHRRVLPFSSPCPICGAVLAVEWRTRVSEG